MLEKITDTDIGVDFHLQSVNLVHLTFMTSRRKYHLYALHTGLNLYQNMLWY